MEIDPRAAQIARLVLAMCARELDRRFFGRGVQADIAVLAPVALGEGDVPQGSALEKKKDLVDALAHLDEVGSLLAPGEGDLAAVREAIELTGSDGLFGSSSKEKLQRALSTCETLARRHDCVVANPPYMGSSSFGPFMSRWVKKNYPDVKSDLCTCFIERGFSLAKDRGYAAMITMQSWMFLGSFEKMRSSLIGSKSILSMLHLGPRAFDAIGGEVVNVTADVVYNGRSACEGAYVRLVDINGSDAKRQKALEAIGNPGCGWFYRRDAETFKQIPGTPIAYWASDGLLSAMVDGVRLSSFGRTSKGIITGKNDKFIRLWWECPAGAIGFSSTSVSDLFGSRKWHPCTKGGSYRKWFGNLDSVIDWSNNGHGVFESASREGNHAQDYSDELKFKPAISWSAITSSIPSFRYASNCLSEHAGMCLFVPEDKIGYILSLLNSSVSKEYFSLIAPTLNVNAGDVDKFPVLLSCFNLVDGLFKENRGLSKTDWDSFETSWDFKRHSLL